MIIPAHLVSIARAMAEAAAGPPGAGMWTTGLSPDGDEPASHYVSSGPIAAEFADLLVDGHMLHEAAGGQVPLTSCLDLIAMSTVVDIATERPFDTFMRLGLKMVQEPYVMPEPNNPYRIYMGS